MCDVRILLFEHFFGAGIDWLDWNIEEINKHEIIMKED